MSSIPSNLSRVPTLLASSFLLSNITRSNLDLLQVQTQLATNKRIGKFSDDAIGAAAISVLQDQIERGQQRLQNLSAAQSSLDFLDSTLGDANDLVLQAKSIASDQVNSTSDAATRANQAIVIDGIIRSLFQLSNRQTNSIFVLGGSTATKPPIEELRGGFRYIAKGSGLLTDLGSWDDIPITIGADSSIGQTSSRLRGFADLNPALTSSTRLSDLFGARNLGVSKGQITFSVNGGTPVQVDLSNANSIQDVIDSITAAIRQYETDNVTTVLDPGAISISGSAIAVDVAAGVTLQFADVGTNVAAQDLGLSGLIFDDPAVTVGNDLNPKLTLLTPVSALSGVTPPLESIRVRFTQGRTTSYTDINLAAAQTVGDIKSIIESQAPGTRVEINADQTGIDIFNEVAGVQLSIEEVPGGAETATELGIRSLSAQTALADFNNGRGVRIVDNQFNPITNVIDRQYNRDFRITLGSGQAFDVDLRPQDLVNVQSILDRINQEFTDALAQPPINASAPALVAGDFAAQLTDGPNGIAFVQSPGVNTGPISVSKLNNSAAAQDLGLLAGSFDSPSATFVAQDAAKVRVNNLFSILIDLRDALRANDTAGITVAGEELEGATDRLAQARALVGVYANRVDRATQRQEDLSTLDEKFRSSLQDADYAQASIRFTQLQTQLQAALQSGVSSQSLSLLDFLG